MNNPKCSKNSLMLGIPEASGFYIAEMVQKKNCNDENSTGSKCATCSFSLRIFGRKCTIVKKINVNDIFTCNTVLIARHFSDAAAVFHHRLHLW